MTHEPSFGHVDWENYSHQALWDMIMRAQPTTIMHRAAALDDLAGALANDIDQLHSLLTRLLSTWTGPAAEQTATMIRPALEWATSAATTASEISHRLGQYADAIDTARHHMPAPVGMLDQVAAGRTVTVTNLAENEPELNAVAHHGTVTPEQAAARKAQAVTVMRQFQRHSSQASHGMPTFADPPKVRGLPTTMPAPPPPPRTPRSPKTSLVPASVPPATHDPSTDPSTAGTTTSTSGFVPPTDAGLLGGGGGLGGVGGGGGGAFNGLPGLSGGGVLSGVPGAMAAGAGTPVMTGTGPLSGAAEEEAASMRLAAANAAGLAEEGGWTGFPPMGAGGRRPGQDGEHRDRYSGRPDLVGELPPAYPPVLGL
jgi:uncharacterized protein YukE